MIWHHPGQVPRQTLCLSRLTKRTHCKRQHPPPAARRSTRAASSFLLTCSHGRPLHASPPCDTRTDNRLRSHIEREARFETNVIGDMTGGLRGEPKRPGASAALQTLSLGKSRPIPLPARQSATSALGRMGGSGREARAESPPQDERRNNSPEGGIKQNASRRTESPEPHRARNLNRTRSPSRDKT